MERTPTKVPDLTPFHSALHLHPTTEAVVEHNISKLHASGQPVATIKAVHTGANASKASPDDAGGLHPIICMAQGARVMLTSNLWVEAGLVNGSMGTVAAICYRSGEAPPSLPVSIMVHFDSYSGPAYPDGTVPITAVRRSWSMSGVQCSRLQLPLKLAWAVTIHKAQGLTLDKVVIDVGKKEFSSGLTFVACSRVRHLNDILFDPPFPFQRVGNLSRSQRLQERLSEDSRLQQLEAATLLLLTSRHLLCKVAFFPGTLLLPPHHLLHYTVYLHIFLHHTFPHLLVSTVLPHRAHLRLLHCLVCTLLSHLRSCLHHCLPCPLQHHHFLLPPLHLHHYLLSPPHLLHLDMYAVH